MTSGLTVKGLKKQITIVEEIVEIKKSLGREYSYEKDLLKSWRTYLPGGRNHHKIAQNNTG